VPRLFLQKNEYQGWDLYEDLAEKIIQWEPTPEKFKNTNPISSKGGLHSIESSIATEARISNLAKRLKLLKTKELILVNQVSPNQIPNSVCTYCQAMNHVFEEYPIFHAQQMLPEPMNVAFLRSHNNSHT